MTSENKITCRQHIEQMVTDLIELVRAANQQEEFEDAARIQAALIAVSKIQCASDFEWMVWPLQYDESDRSFLRIEQV